MTDKAEFCQGILDELKASRVSFPLPFRIDGEEAEISFCDVGFRIVTKDGRFGDRALAEYYFDRFVANHL